MENESFCSQQLFWPKKTLFRFFSEIPFSSANDPALLRKGYQREPLVVDKFLPKHPRICPQYYYLRSLQLERIEEYFPQSGAWSTSCLRIIRFWGSPPNTQDISTEVQKANAFFYDSHWMETGEFNWNKFEQDKVIEAKNRRILFYHRVDIEKSLHNLHYYSSIEDYLEKIKFNFRFGCIESGNYEYSLAINLTPEWHTPPKGGVLRIPSSPNVLGSHQVTVVGHVPEGIVIQNSWGPEWGEGGHCVIPMDAVNANIIDAWTDCFPGVFPLLQTTHGLVCLSWKTNSINPFPEVYCEEIVDASSGERLAWAFATKNIDGELVIEEFFVWPEYRKRGYARILANRLKLLGEITGRPLVMLVPWADCETHKLAGVIKTAEMLDLGLIQSDTPVGGLIGRKKIKNIFVKNECFSSNDRGFLEAEPNEIASKLDVPFRPEGPRDELLPRFVPVWFATNREPTDNWSEETRFGGTISNKVIYGRCDVTIPKWHRFGKIKQNLWQKWLSLFQQGCIDKNVHEVNYPLQVLHEELFWSSVSQSFFQMQQKGYQSDGLVFLHGYNNSFDDAAIYAGQLAFDLKIPNTAFFSWPSQGTYLAYPKDEETIRLSENAIFDFLIRFSEACPDGKIHVIAHSMGNRGLLSAFYLKILNETSKCFPKKRIGQVFLAAPDVNTQEFKERVAGIVQVSDRVTLYTAKQDHALRISQRLHNYPRAGTAPPFTIVEGVDTIHVPLVSSREDMIKHSYFSKMASLLYDIDSLIKSNQPPRNRLRLRQMVTGDKIYWEFTQ